MEGTLVRDYGSGISVREVEPTEAKLIMRREYRVMQGSLCVRVFYSIEEADAAAMKLVRKVLGV